MDKPPGTSSSKTMILVLNSSMSAKTSFIDILVVVMIIVFCGAAMMRVADREDGANRML
jgi:hypothetical protein